MISIKGKYGGCDTILCRQKTRSMMNERKGYIVRVGDTFMSLVVLRQACQLLNELTAKKKKTNALIECSYDSIVVYVLYIYMP